MDVSLKAGISISNFLVIPLSSITITYAGTFLNVAIIFLLRDPNFYGIEESKIGRVTNDILFYTQLMQIFFTLAAGYIYDIVGRRWTILATLFPGAILVIFIPDAAPSIPLLIALRMGLVLAMSALGSHPFVNDYVKRETRGRAVAF